MQHPGYPVWVPAPAQVRFLSPSTTLEPLFSADFSSPFCRWLKNLYWNYPAFKDTTQFEHIKKVRYPLFRLGSSPPLRCCVPREKRFADLNNSTTPSRISRSTRTASRPWARSRISCRWTRRCLLLWRGSEGSRKRVVGTSRSTVHIRQEQFKIFQEASFQNVQSLHPSVGSRIILSINRTATSSPPNPSTSPSPVLSSGNICTAPLKIAPFLPSTTSTSSSIPGSARLK